MNVPSLFMLSTLVFMNNDKEDKTKKGLKAAAVPNRVTLLQSLLTKWHVSTVVILRWLLFVYVTATLTAMKRYSFESQPFPSWKHVQYTCTENLFHIWIFFHKFVFILCINSSTENRVLATTAGTTLFFLILTLLLWTLLAQLLTGTLGFDTCRRNTYKRSNMRLCESQYFYFCFIPQICCENLILFRAHVPLCLN